MRIGNTFNWLLLILIAFGFILSNYIQVREENSQLRIDTASKDDEMNNGSKDLAVCNGNLLDIKARNEELIVKISQQEDTIGQMDETVKTQQAAIDKINNEIQACQAENEKKVMQLDALDIEIENLRIQNGQLSETNNAHEDTIAQLQSDKLQMWVRIQELEDEIANLADVDQVPEIPENNVKPSEIILGVILVAQITFTIAQQKRKPGLVQYRQNTDYIRLTPQERSLIIRLRRKSWK